MLMLGNSALGEGMAVLQQMSHLDVAVGNAQAVAVVHGNNQLLEDPASIILRQEVDLR